MRQPCSLSGSPVAPRFCNGGPEAPECIDCADSRYLRRQPPAAGTAAKRDARARTRRAAVLALPKLGADRKSDLSLVDLSSGAGEDTVTIAQSGWCLLRASSEKPEHPVLDDYVYATTSPIYVSVGGAATKSAEDAAFFLSWIGRLEAAVRSNQDWNTSEEKTLVLKTLDQARQVYAGLQN